MLGRADDAGLQTTWDDRISRRHVEITVDATGVKLTRLSDASNPIFVDGADPAEK